MRFLRASLPLTLAGVLFGCTVYDSGPYYRPYNYGGGYYSNGYYGGGYYRPYYRAYAAYRPAYGYRVRRAVYRYR